jgi:homogentisate 1,2-dioxygenase
LEIGAGEIAVLPRGLKFPRRIADGKRAATFAKITARSSGFPI